MTKSYVTLEQANCPICGTTFGTGNLLLDTRLRDRFEKDTTTHFAICGSCNDKLHSGYVGLVGINANRSISPYKPDTVYRTGQSLFVRRSVWPSLFNMPIKDDCPFVYVEPEVIERLIERAE